MLGRYFYHQVFRKSILAFGSTFNNIVIKRKADPTVDVKGSIETVKVPIMYGPREKFLAILAQKPGDVRQQTQLSLPRISFEMKGIRYDAGRKVPPTQFMRSAVGTQGSGEQYRQYMPVPYDIEIELSILSKTQDDGLQILEQILPYFHPSLNVSITVIDETKESRDIAIILNNVNYDDTYESDYTQRRTLIWTLGFTVKTYLFGPVDRAKDIRKVTIDYRTDIVKRPAELRYTAEVESTDEPPIPRNEIDPMSDGYTVVEQYQDILADDNDYFSLG